MAAAECHIIGNYAQSELGHGTYLRCATLAVHIEAHSQQWPGDHGNVRQGDTGVHSAHANSHRAQVVAWCVRAALQRG